MVMEMTRMRVLERRRSFEEGSGDEIEHVTLAVFLTSGGQRAIVGQSSVKFHEILAFLSVLERCRRILHYSS
jgi:hypothetical protein